MVDNYEEGGGEKRKKHIQVYIRRCRKGDTGRYGWVTVAAPADKSRVSEKQSHSTTGTGIPNGVKEEWHALTYLPNCKPLCG